jgi:ABC-2 type transport system permease protein
MTSVIRASSFFSRWLADVLRQPALMLILVVAPFLVLFAFGRGVEIGGPQPRTLIVRDGAPDEPLDPLPEELGEHIIVVGETTDVAYARRELDAGRVDAIAMLPNDSTALINSGRQAPIRVVLAEIDPVRRSYAFAFLSDQVATLNRRTIERAIGDAQSSAQEVTARMDEARGYVDLMREASGGADSMRSDLLRLRDLLAGMSTSVDRLTTAAGAASFLVPGLRDAGEESQRLQQQFNTLRSTVDDLAAGAEGEDATLPTPEEIDAIDATLDEFEAASGSLSSIPPDVLSQPFVLNVEYAAYANLSFAAFYAPAVLVLLLQHLAITLGALSMARLRLLRLTDLLRAAPVRPGEVVVGHYLSYGVLCLVAGVALLGLMIWTLGVPVLGSWVAVIGTVVALVLASLGLGFVISLLSRNEHQAAQLAMVVLLASVFFSGFAFSLDQITLPVRGLSFLLPATYGIRTLQDVMLRGVLRHLEDIAILATAGVALLVFTVWLFRRDSRPE